MSEGGCESRVTRVVVHSNGAHVTRMVTLPRSESEDPEELVIPGLSPFLQPSSLEVRVEGSRSVLGAETHLMSGAPEPQTSGAPGRDADGLALRRLGHQRGQLAQLRHLIARTMPLASPSAFAGGAARAAVERGLAVNAFIEGLLADLDQRLGETDLEIERRERPQRGSLRLPAVASPRAREARVTLGPGRAERLVLGYLVPLARWWPAYTLSVTGTSARGELRLEALVAQASQEDWSEIELFLSASDFQTELQHPELPPLRLGSRVAHVRRGYREPPPGLDALFAPYDRATAEAEPDPGAMPAERDWSASDVYMKAKLVDSPRPSPKGAALEAPAPHSPDADGLDAPVEPRATTGLSPTARWLDYPHLVLGPLSDRERRGRLTPSPDTVPGTDQRELVASLERLEMARPARRLAGTQDLSLSVPGRVSLPSSHSRTERVRLESLDIKSATRLSCIPKSEARVHRVLEFPNTTGRVLLPGRVDILLEGSFVSATELDSTPPERLLRLSLGVEERISVSRTVEVVDSPGGSVLSQTTHLTQRVSIRLTSRMSEAATVEVIDRLPVSDDKGVTIELVDSDAPAERYRSDDVDTPLRGALRWSVVVPAGGSTSIRFSYRVSVPSKQAAPGARIHE